MDSKYLYTDIILVLVLTMLCAVLFYTPVLDKSFIVSILNLLLIVFLPGYMLIAFLFPKKGDLDLIERVVLTVIFSVVITALTGMILNYTRPGIHIETMLLSLVLITLVLSALTILRRNRLSPEERLRYDFGKTYRNIGTIFSQESKIGKFLSIIVVISLVLALTSTAYVITKPRQEASYSQFYILGPDGKINNYPNSLIAGQQGNLTIGIVNNENKQTTYRLLVKSNGQVQLDETITLDNNQSTEIPFIFAVGNPGLMKMEFFLYKLPDNDNAYRYLNLWVNVTDVSQAV